MFENPEYVNAGLIAEKDGWIYFADPANGMALSKKKVDDPAITPLSKRQAAQLMFLGGWVYFVSMADDSATSVIYRVRTDGTKEQRVGVNSVFNYHNDGMIVSDQGVFFSNGDDDNRLYRMDLDGGNPILLTDRSALNLAMDGEWIFFLYPRYDGTDIFRVRSDGSGESEVIKNATFSSMIAWKGWLYYCKSPQEIEEEGLFQVRYDGSDDMKVTDFLLSSYQIYEDVLYVVRGCESVVYSMNLDGSGLKQLTQNKGGILQVAGGWIYLSYSNIYEVRDESFRLRLDGTGLERLN